MPSNRQLTAITAAALFVIFVMGGAVVYVGTRPIVVVCPPCPTPPPAPVQHPDQTETDEKLKLGAIPKPDVPQIQDPKTQEKIESASDYKEHTLLLGSRQSVNFYGILNKAEWEDVMRQALKVNSKEPESIIVLDRHFNAGGGSRPEILVNPGGEGFGHLIMFRHQAIYGAKGFVHLRNGYVNGVINDRHDVFRYLRAAKNYKLAAAIDEFGFMDDRHNTKKISDYIWSHVGVMDIAAATVDAALLSGKKHIVLTIGHHRGMDSGAVDPYSQKTEKQYGVLTLNAIREVLQNPVGNLTAYSPQKGGANVWGVGGEGGYEAAKPNLDGKSVVTTLADIAAGTAKVLTVAANPNYIGKKIYFPRIPCIDKDGNRKVLSNVRAYIHDTGSAMAGAPLTRMDIPVDRDLGNKPQYANTKLWREGVTFIQGWPEELALDHIKEDETGTEGGPTNDSAPPTN